ncbi:hypothetical protein FDP41_003195 [Naegleria fowleri]|uniref:Glycerophosphocholine acyltransferase 1 n=1 Tax=Naegleria fowleri TaxID=5763 RepID=A0A6A5BIY4_NAEFO|nr:uncharacterized protein FDP41_003195 [Naegleria fowleri]KAF0977873.1 hypothetical protein FDP41_003195 [Naegleria fowleri]
MSSSNSASASSASQLEELGEKASNQPSSSSPDVAKKKSTTLKTSKLSLNYIPKFSVSFNDKVAFTFGVLLLVSTTFIFGYAPRWLPYWYALWMAPLMIYRFVDFHAQHAHYFMIDFCYIGNLALMIYLFFYPSSPQLFALTFANNNGPILFAIVFWRNSLVFHDWDKLTSCFIHTFPPLISFAIRWFPEQFPEYRTCIEPTCEVNWTHTVLPHLGFFLFWLVSYYLKTELVDKRFLQKRTHFITSYRWITEMDKKSKSYQLGQKFNPQARLFAFMAFQLFFHLLTVIPTTFMFNNIYINAAILLFNYVVMVHNGSNFYFEKFVSMVAEKKKV